MVQHRIQQKHHKTKKKKGCTKNTHDQQYNITGKHKEQFDVYAVCFETKSVQFMDVKSK